MTAAAVELAGVTVRYGEVVGLRGADLSAERGEIHALVGENGAGKSTLMRALFGLAPIGAGSVRVDGADVGTPSPRVMMERGVGMVHQHFMLVPPLTVAENVVLGVERVRAGLLDRQGAEREVAELSARHGLRVEPSRRVADLSVGEQQRVEILKALHRGARILLLDEPTAVLTPPEVADLFRVLRALREGGGTVLLSTHKLDEVLAIADRATVLRRGEVVARFERDARADLDLAAIARAMVGREPAPLPPRSRAVAGAARLSVDGLDVARGSALAIAGASLAVRAGEIVGIAGVDGNGQSELAAAIVGTTRPRRGTIRLGERDVTRLAPAARRALGLAFIPEDRQRVGLLLDRSIADNLLLGRIERYARVGRLDRSRLDRDARALIERFDIRAGPELAGPGLPARALSGGNQQKVVVARELSRSPAALVAAQPTRGIDIGAIELVHRELDRLRAAGGAVLLLSAELEELLALADRIAVLHRGRLVATLERDEATLEQLGALMTGARPGDAAA